MKHLTVLILCFATVLCLLCACGTEGDPADTTTAAQTTAPVTSLPDTEEPDTDAPDDTDEPEEEFPPFEYTAMLINNGKPNVTVIYDTAAASVAEQTVTLFQKYGAQVQTVEAGGETGDLPLLTFALDSTIPDGCFTLCPDKTGLYIAAPTEALLQTAFDQFKTLVESHATGDMVGYTVYIPSDELQFVNYQPEA